MQIPVRFARGIATITFAVTTIVIPLMPSAPAGAATPVHVDTGGIRSR